MASNIDPTKPDQGQATTESVRDNFQAAKTEIEANQNDIATNAADISQNATDIGTNAAAITDLQSSKADITYVDSENTAQDAVIDGKVDKAGDTMTGKLNVAYNGATINLETAGTNTHIFFKNNGVNVGLLYHDVDNSRQVLRLYGDNGSTIETDLTLEAGGNVFLTGTGSAPTAANHLTRKDYVDGLAPHALAKVSADGTLNSRSYGIASATKTGTGTYELTLSAPLPANTGITVGSCDTRFNNVGFNLSSTTVFVYIASLQTAAAIDASFELVVYGPRT